MQQKQSKATNLMMQIKEFDHFNMPMIIDGDEVRGLAPMPNESTQNARKKQEMTENDKKCSKKERYNYLMRTDRS